MRLSRPAAVAGAVLLIGGLGFSNADAAATLSKSNLLPQGETITVNYSGLVIPSGNSSVVFIQQCYKNDAGPFNPSTDCSGSTGINPAVVAGAGSASFTVFGGDDPNLQEWACGDGGDINNVLAPIIVNTCYVRLAPGNKNNTAGDEFYPVTFTAVPETTTTLAPTTTVEPTTTLAPTTTVEPTTTLAPTTTVEPTTTLAPTTTVAPPNDVPEVPLNVLLPLGAAAVLGGSVMIARRRQNSAA